MSVSLFLSKPILKNTRRSPSAEGLPSRNHADNRLFKLQVILKTAKELNQAGGITLALISLNLMSKFRILSN